MKDFIRRLEEANGQPLPSTLGIALYKGGGIVQDQNRIIAVLRPPLEAQPPGRDFLPTLVTTTFTPPKRFQASDIARTGRELLIKGRPAPQDQICLFPIRASTPAGGDIALDAAVNATEFRGERVLWYNLNDFRVHQHFYVVCHRRVYLYVLVKKQPRQWIKFTFDATADMVPLHKIVTEVGDDYRATLEGFKPVPGDLPPLNLVVTTPNSRRIRRTGFNTMYARRARKSRAG